jgi:tetratricopeptide (TPR) repeat protein
MMRRPVVAMALAATALVGIVALSMYGDEEEDEEEESGVKSSKADVTSEETSDPKNTTLPQEAQQLYEIAVALSKRGDYVQGEKIMHKVLEIVETKLGANHGAVAEVLGNLGLLLQAQQKTDEAELVMRRALVIEMSIFGNESTEAATMMSSLASILEEVGRFSDAQELFRKCLTIKQLSGKKNEVASAHCLLAGNLRNMGQLDESETNYLQAVAILSENFGDSHESVDILNKTIALFPKLRSLKDVKLKVDGELMNKADSSWSAITSDTLSLELICAEPRTAHSELLNAADMDGKVAFVLRGECSFSEKVTRCVEAGAKAVIVMSNDEKHPDAVFQMGAPETYQSSVPVFMVSYNNGQKLSSLHLNGKTSIEIGP